MLRSIGKQSGEFVEPVPKKKREATVGRISLEHLLKHRGQRRCDTRSMLYFPFWLQRKMGSKLTGRGEEEHALEREGREEEWENMEVEEKGVRMEVKEWKKRERKRRAKGERKGGEEMEKKSKGDDGWKEKTKKCKRESEGAGEMGRKEKRRLEINREKIRPECKYLPRRQSPTRKGTKI